MVELRNGTREEPGTLTQGIALFSLVPLVWESNPKLRVTGAMLGMLQRHTVHIFYAHLRHKRIRINVRAVGLEHCDVAGGVDAVDLQREALLHVLHNVVNDVRMCTKNLANVTLASRFLAYVIRTAVAARTAGSHSRQLHACWRPSMLSILLPK